LQVQSQKKSLLRTYINRKNAWVIIAVFTTLFIKLYDNQYFYKKMSIM